MEKEKYYELINELEIYFADVIQKRFKEYVNESIESNLHFAPDIQSHNLINDLLENEGFEVYGMNVNMDGFQLLLDFKYTYLKIENFMFTRLAIDFKNDGNYTVYLDTNSFEDTWTVNLVDDFHRYLKMTEDELEKLIRDIKKTHLMLILSH
jgi:hypothetical protein